MDGPSLPKGTGHKPAPSARVDEVCDRFEAAWRAGHAPRIEDLVAATPDNDRTALLGELVALERELRSKRGEHPSVREYLVRFPEYASIIHAVFSGKTDPDMKTLSPQRDDTGGNLLFGVLALQNNFIGRNDLLGAFAAWVANQSRPLARVLVDRGALDESRRALLEALVAEHIKHHRGDAEASLAAVSSLGSVREDLEKLDDAGIHASLAATASSAVGQTRETEEAKGTLLIAMSEYTI